MSERDHGNGKEGDQDPSQGKEGDQDPGKGKGKEGDQDPKKGKGKEGDESSYITVDRLTSVLDARQRKQAVEFDKFTAEQKELQQKITTLMETLSSSKKEPGEKSGGGSGGKQEPENQELIELRRKVDELTKKAEVSGNRADEEAKMRRDGEFKNAVTSALSDAGCEKVEEAYLVIQPRLTHTDDGRIFATVKTEYGEEDVDLQTYIKKYFSEDVLPHVFKGRMRTGSPAGGDDGAGGGSFKFTKEQALDPKFYLEHADEVRAAIEKGQIKGLPKGSGAK